MRDSPACGDGYDLVMRGRHRPTAPSRVRTAGTARVPVEAAPADGLPPDGGPAVPGIADLTHAPSVGRLLSRHGLWLTKSLGQHLLIDRGVLDRIVEAADLRPEMEVLEVGPGVGVLTTELVSRVRRVLAVEVDPRMATVLRETVAHPSLEVVEADAMGIDPADLFGGRPYSVVANLPYNLATALVRRLLSMPAPSRPVEMVVMMQREVAQRMAARPGDLSALGIEIQVAAAVDLLFEVPPTAFFPAPKVTSAVVRVRPYDVPAVPLVPGPRRFFQLVRAGFAHRRKQLHNALGDLGLGGERIQAALEEAGIARSRRAETLTLEEWSTLSAAMWAELPSPAAAGEGVDPERAGDGEAG